VFIPPPPKGIYRGRYKVKMKLVEIFGKLNPRLVGGSHWPKYRALFSVRKRSDPQVVTLEMLEEYARQLELKVKSRNPKLKVILRPVKVDGKTLFRFGVSKYWKDEEGKKHTNWARVPIYFDLEEQRFFVPVYYILTRPKLTNYIVMRTLGALGVSQSTYIKPVR